MSNPCLAAVPDHHLKARAEAGERAAIDELAKRGLAATPETIAELARSRRKYDRLAMQSAGDWGYSGRAK